LIRILKGEYKEDKKVCNKEDRHLFPPYPKSIEFTQQDEPLGWMRFN